MDWKRFFDRLGMNGTRWQWRIYRWQQRWEARPSKDDSPPPSVSRRHKFCEHCGALLDREQETCLRCGKKAPRWEWQAFRRQLALVLPSGLSLTSVVLFLILLIGLLQIFPSLYRQAGRLGAFYRGDQAWWQWISYAYFHGGLLHLVFNAMALSQLGPMVEGQIGSARAMVVYTFTALTALALFIWTGGGALVGASGALFGWIGFGLAYNHFLGGWDARRLRAFYLQWTLYGLIFGFLVGGALRMAHSAHLGGWIGGLFMGWLMERLERGGNPRTRLWGRLAAVCWLLTAASLLRVAFGL